MDHIRLTTAQRDRAAGSIVGMAVGDALGAGYEFAPRCRAQEVHMKGGGLGPFAPSEWTDDTSMAMPLLNALAQGQDLLVAQTQDDIARQWADWAKRAPDVGVTTRHVLNRYDPASGAQSLQMAAAGMFGSGSRSAGNGSLMRTAPLTLGFLDDPDGLAHAARLYSDLTHGDLHAADACVLWNLAQRHAILNGAFDLAVGLLWIPHDRRALWSETLEQAESGRPEDFPNNGWVVHALQSAWAAICRTDAGGPEHFEWTLRNVVSAGGDTDTVAAIAGGLLGARWGVSAIPLAWRRHLFGWPMMRDRDLLRAVAGATGSPWPDDFNPYSVEVGVHVHPDDPGVLLGGVRELRQLPAGVDAVVSLCRLGDAQMPSRIKADDHVFVWLIDSADPGENPNLDLVAQQAVETVSRLRHEGKTVYLHCVQALSRTPFIAALYGAACTGGSPLRSLEAVRQALPATRMNAGFQDYLERCV